MVRDGERRTASRKLYGKIQHVERKAFWYSYSINTESCGLGHGSGVSQCCTTAEDGLIVLAKLARDP